MKRLDGLLVAGTAAAFPAIITALLLAQALQGDMATGVVTLLLLAYAAVSYLRDRRRGICNIMSVGCFSGIPMGVIAGLSQAYKFGVVL
ncbi:hypothetical protein [Eleftheria terrae]|uniref:hypothetical protein n=1 Tax=Eleftheria terrae TaxID=1597781 RepID=UPI00263A432D|nr:hypothetical protein [Eleftheria terrae]WKB50519.1 hypothetical protein N7L95_00285 [Eleftheria terrae]